MPPLAAPEPEMLAAWLDLQRATLAVQCAGLTDSQLRERAVPPSSLSLLGLVRHMAEGEHQWFALVLCREPSRPVLRPSSRDDPRSTHTQARRQT